MSELKYDKTFEEALEAVKKGFKVKLIYYEPLCNELDDMLFVYKRSDFTRDFSKGWAIIPKEPKMSKKEKLIEMIKNKRKILVKNYEGLISTISELDEFYKDCFLDDQGNLNDFDEIEVLTPSEIQPLLEAAKELEGCGE